MRTFRNVNRWGPPALLAMVLLYYVGYVKDDAYISLRYAANWVRGQGLTFNPGQPLEGYTNFLWTAALAGLLRLHVPALVAAKGLGLLTAFAGLFWVRRLAAGAAPDVPGAGDRAAWLFAASPTVGLWAASGMEPTAMAALGAGAALLCARARRSRGWLDGSAAGLGLSACALLRPEGHLLAALGGLGAPRALPALAAVLVPYHLLRLRTFGHLVPNPYYVKAAAPSLAAGAAYGGLFLLFFGHGLLLWLALRRARRGGPLVRLGAAVCLLFLAYLVYLGGDEMRWFRLYAPALGLLFALAAPALPGRALPAFVLFGLCAHATAWPLRDYLAQDERGYFALGEAIAGRARPGDGALFQDAGATPFRALDVPFSDPIGVVDGGVARLCARYRWNPLRGWGPPAFEQAVREELLGRDPRFVALVAYVPRSLGREVRALYEHDPEAALAPFLAGNNYAHGIPEDPRFRARYRFSGAWRRNDGYYLALYERALVPSPVPGLR